VGAEPAGFDLFYSNTGLQDYRALDIVSAVRVDEAIDLILEDPTERNPQVRNLSNTIEGVLQISHNDVTVYYRMANALVAEVIAMIPLPLDLD
jgi:hypothetical protein